MWHAPLDLDKKNWKHDDFINSHCFTFCFNFSSILWTKYGILVDDTPIYTIGILGMITQSAYLLFYYINTRDKVSR